MWPPKQRHLPEGAQDRPHGILADRADIRDDHDADDQAGAQHVKSWQVRPDLLKGRRHKQQGEIPIDDRRHGAQQFQSRLHRFSDCPRGIFTQIDRDQTAHRNRHASATPVVTRVPETERKNSIMRLGKQRGPLTIGEKLP